MTTNVRASRVRKAVGYAAFGLFFVFIIFFSLIEPNIDFAPAGNAASPSFVFERVRLTYLDMGKTTWDVRSEAAQISHDKSSILLEKMDGAFFQNQRPVVHVSAPEASVIMKNANVNLSHPAADFKVEKRAMHLTAKTMDWEADRQIFHANGDVKLRSENLVLFGKKFEVRVPIRKMTVKGDSRAEFTL